MHFGKENFNLFIPPAENPAEVDFELISDKCNQAADVIFSKLEEGLNGHALKSKTLGEKINVEIEQALLEVPELKNHSEMILGEVRKRIAYYSHKDRFEEERDKLLDLDVISSKDFSAASHSLVKRNIRTKAGKPDWSFVAKNLNIEDRFHHRERSNDKREWTLQKAVSYLINHLVQKQPASFNRKWIKDNDEILYRHILKILAEENISWAKFIQMLSEEWQAKWRNGISDEMYEKLVEKNSKRNFQTAIEELNQMLRRDQPKIVKSGYIRKNLGLYLFFIRYFNKQDKSFDLMEIQQFIDEPFKSRLRAVKTIDKYLPNEFYEDNSEMDMMLEPYAGKLYVLEIASGGKDKEIRNSICEALAKLAQKGNVNAKNKLADVAYHQVQEWTMEPQLEQFQYRIDDVMNIVERCIYYYDPKISKSFLNYLLSTLEKKS